MQNATRHYNATQSAAAQSAPQAYDMPNATRQHKTTQNETSSGRHPYHNPHTSLGATAHWVNTAGVLIPLLIPEFIKDPAKQWRYARIASVATALVAQGFWAHKISKERQEARERELTCQSQG